MAEEKSLQERLDDLKKGLETFTKQEVEASLTSIQDEIKKLDTKADKVQIDKLQTSIDGIKTIVDNLNEQEAARVIREEKNQEAIDKFSVHLQKVPLTGKQDNEKSFNEIIGETIENNAEKIKKHHRYSGQTLSFELPGAKRDDKGNLIEVKTVGDMSIPANFPDAPTLYTSVQPMIQSPYNRVWLSDVLQVATSNAPSLTYPKENGGEGAAALWTDPTADKPQMDFDFTTEVGYFKWIAGIVIVAREMLDDIPFMTSYIQNKMLISLKTAENAFILNGSADTNPVDGLLDVAQAYDGPYTAAVEKLLYSAYGQIVEDTNEFYVGTTAVLRPKDSLAISLNKADGSGEYTLPPGTTAIAPNGRLNIGLQVVTTTGITAGSFVVFDRSAAIFVRRMAPELRMFEDATLAKKNKVMFRIEERVTLAILNDNAIVTGSTAAGS